MDRITSIAEEILQKAANDGGGHFYPAQLEVSKKDFDAAMKFLSPFGKETTGDWNGASPIFTINDLGRAHIASGGWSEKERQENLARKRYIINRNIAILTLTATIVFGLLSLLMSCHRQVGNYFYDDGVSYHINNSCGDSQKSIVKCKDVYSIVYKTLGEYRCGTSWGYQRIIHFCADCITDEQMKQIEDSIAKYGQHE
ncbi:MAG: hypothetical protein IJ155_04255 [Prevotella sp.]|nr:hypothetical protein [Prevotella sp.]